MPNGAAVEAVPGFRARSCGPRRAPGRRPNQVCFKDAVACLEERREAGAQRAASQRPQEQSGAAAASENPPLDASSRKVRRATSVAHFINTVDSDRRLDAARRSEYWRAPHEPPEAPSRSSAMLSRVTSRC